MLRREHADAARAGQSKNGWCFKQKPAQRETNDSCNDESFVSFFIAFRGLFDTEHRELYGTALTPGGRWLRPPRQIGITSNRCHAGSLRGVAVRGYYLIAVITCIRGNTSHCSTASTRGPRGSAVGERLVSQAKARSKSNERFAQWHESFVALFYRHRGLLIQCIANCTELPSRRAGGGFGHPVRVVLPRIGVMPEVYVVWLLEVII